LSSSSRATRSPYARSYSRPDQPALEARGQLDPAAARRVHEQTHAVHRDEGTALRDRQERSTHLVGRLLQAGACEDVPGAPRTRMEGTEVGLEGAPGNQPPGGRGPAESDE